MCSGLFAKQFKLIVYSSLLSDFVDLGSGCGCGGYLMGDVHDDDGVLFGQFHHSGVIEDLLIVIND